MFLQRKALYNLIQLNLKRFESKELKNADLQPWQTTNYREKSSEELFESLRELGIALSLEALSEYSTHLETPEDVVEILAQDREPLQKDQILLLIFELWRRHFPEKRSVSIFCDELDFQMMAHDTDKPNEVQDALAYLQQLLDEHVDKGLKPNEAFQLIQVFCANDIESFLFDYTLEQIDVGDYLYAAELIEGFKPFVIDTLWFDYLQARTTITEDPEEGYALLEAVIKKVRPPAQLDLIEEILHFLAGTGNHSLFHTLAKKTLPHLSTEEEFKEYLEACYAHYDYLELKQAAFAIAGLFHSRTHIASDTPLSQKDPGVLEIKKLLDQKLHFVDQ